MQYMIIEIQDVMNNDLAYYRIDAADNRCANDIGQQLCRMKNHSNGSKITVMVFPFEENADRMYAIIKEKQ